MSLHRARVEWTREGDFLAGRYSRAHRLHFDGGTVVPGSPSPGVVPAPYSMEAAVDPEEMFVGALSACHMLWFLDYARRAGRLIERYVDEAEGTMARVARGRIAITRVVLRPHVVTASPMEADAMAELHRQAHESCFIANSVLTEVLVEPRG